MLKYKDLNSVINTAEYRNINESYIRKVRTPYSENFDIFLCHSSRDIDEIVKLKSYLLKEYNKKAYVCEVDDPQLDPAKVCRLGFVLLHKVSQIIKPCGTNNQTMCSFTSCIKPDISILYG